MQARKQVNQLLRLGHKVSVVTWQYDRRLPRLEQGPGWKIVRAPLLHWRGKPKWGRATYPIAAVGLLPLLLRELRNADILHVHQLLREAFLGSIIGKVIGRPVVAKAACEARWPEGDLAIMRSGRLYGPGSAQMVEFTRRNATAVVAPGRAMVAELQDAGFPHVYYIPNGVDLPALQARSVAAAAVREQLRIPAGKRVILFLGRLCAQKGPDLLLRVWPSVLGRIPQAVLLLAGNGPDLPALRSQARPLGDAVRFCPNEVDGLLYVAGADLLVVPSRGEGMSNVLLEAMASATPCVSTSVSGAPDLISDGKNGRLVPVGAEEELATAIVWMLENPAAASLLGVKARETIAAGFTIDAIVERYVTLYRELLAARASPPP